jgi:hypothetical protein
VSKKQKPFITRIQAEGTTAEKGIASEQLKRRVETFNSRLEGYPLQVRIDALNKVIDKVKDDPTELDFLQALLKTGKWSREVAVLLGQQERLQILRRLK